MLLIDDVNEEGSVWPGWNEDRLLIPEPKARVMTGSAAPAAMAPTKATAYKALSRRSAYAKIRYF